MHIVIEIPDNEIPTRNNDSLEFSISFVEGIPCQCNYGFQQLPEGHGKLKDTDKIVKDGTSKGFCDWYDEIRYADTIIEADKEEIQAESEEI